MTLTLHNTLTRRREPLEPVRPGHVGMYVCGPTVYDLAHIGNARPIVVFDVLYRVLKRLYPTVTYVRNITDIDDKINEASRQSGEPIESITARTTKAFHEDIAALGALPPDVEPRATAYVPQMIALIEALIEAGNAYEAEGHVLFHVPSAPRYGALSGRNRDEMIAGARVEVAPYKRDPADFVLWKPSDETLPGWESCLGARAARLAYRMLGHEPRLPRRDAGHPRRRHGSDLPPPRERNRAERMRLPRRALRPPLGAQRRAHRGGREDVEVARQLRHHPRCAGRDAGRGDPASPAEHALPAPLGLDRRRARPGPSQPGPPLHRAAQCGRGGWGGRRHRRPRGRGRALRRSQHAEGARCAPQARGRPQPSRRRGGQGAGRAPRCVAPAPCSGCCRPTPRRGSAVRGRKAA